MFRNDKTGIFKCGREGAWRDYICPDGSGIRGSIKFNRDAEIKLDDEYSEKLLDKIEKQLSKRDIGATSRFLYEMGMPANFQFFLASMFGVNASDMFEGGRYHNLSDLMSFPSFDPSLKYEKEKPILCQIGQEVIGTFYATVTIKMK